MIEVSPLKHARIEALNAEAEKNRAKARLFNAQAAEIELRNEVPRYD